eukprot:2879692-Amphidinium_carterae.1
MSWIPLKVTHNARACSRSRDGDLVWHPDRRARKEFETETLCLEKKLRGLLSLNPVQNLNISKLVVAKAVG